MSLVYILSVLNLTILLFNTLLIFFLYGSVLLEKMMVVDIAGVGGCCFILGFGVVSQIMKFFIVDPAIYFTSLRK